MPHSRVAAYVDVETNHQEQIAAVFQEVLDGLAIKGIEIFDSEISCISVSDVVKPRRAKRKKKP